MSPEFDSWKEFLSTDKVEQAIKDYVEGEIRTDKKNFGLRMHKGFLVLVTDGEVRQIIDFSEATDGIKKNASQARGDWIFVRGLDNSPRARQKQKRVNDRFGDVNSDNIFKKNKEKVSRRRNKYRGKHRSVIKGTGIRAFFRSDYKARK